jgi:hypothetical protein
MLPSSSGFTLQMDVSGSKPHSVTFQRPYICHGEILPMGEGDKGFEALIAAVMTSSIF